MAKKFYVAWDQGEVRLFNNWPDCQDFVAGRRGVRFKGFNSREEAVEAFRNEGDGEGTHLLLMKAIAELRQADAARQASLWRGTSGPQLPALCVDAACSRNPGPVEYQGVWLPGQSLAFRVGPLEGGTNNIGEYLALVHALAMLAKIGRPDINIYTDSRTAIAWVRNKAPRTALVPSAANARIFDMLRRATAWLQSNTPTNPVLKWDTEAWGEIPADFGRK